jgi:hypothetical protein
MPAHKDDLVNILELSSNYSEPFDDKIISLFENINRNGLDQELPMYDPNDDQVKFSENVDEQRLKIHSNALKILKNKPELNYEEAAMKAVSEFTHEL